MGRYAQVGQEADNEIAMLTADVVEHVNARERLERQLAATVAERDEIQARLDALTQPEPEPEPQPEPVPVWPANGIPPRGQTLLGAATQNLADMEARVGRLGIYRSYYQASQVAGMVQRAQADHQAGRIPWISSKLPYGWAQMATGSGDVWARNLANSLGALGKPVWIALHHEPEGDGTPADWVRLQQRMAPIFRAHPNIAYTIILMGYGQWISGAHPMGTWWPGAEHVDVLGFDPYNWWDTTNSSGRKSTKWTELREYYGKITGWLAANAPATRWGIAETGYSHTAAALPQGSVSTRGTGADWLTRAYDDLKTAGGVALAYFNVDPSVVGGIADHTWPITTNPKVDTFRAVLQRADRWPG